jgi:hypothetical protein
LEEYAQIDKSTSPKEYMYSAVPGQGQAEWPCHPCHRLIYP